MSVNMHRLSGRTQSIVKLVLEGIKSIHSSQVICDVQGGWSVGRLVAGLRWRSGLGDCRCSQLGRVALRCWVDWQSRA